MQRLHLLTKIVPPGILAISLMIVYLTTIAPGLTWANSGADGGDLITATATGGVAHPTGYPFYLLVASVFQAIPIGSLAFRTNLMSAIAATSAALIVYSLVRRALSPSNPTKYWSAGLASGFAFGLAPLFWSQAVITEVYTSLSFRESFDATFSSEMEGYITRVDIWAGHGEPYNHYFPVANHTIDNNPSHFNCIRRKAGFSKLAIG
jgi:hypothetical protein